MAADAYRPDNAPHTMGLSSAGKAPLTPTTRAHAEAQRMAELERYASWPRLDVLGGARWIF